MRRTFGLLACLSITGTTARAQASPTAILDRVTVNPRRPIDFHAIALPETVYVGQQATYQVAVMLSPDARSRLRRNPEFLPPELKGLLAYDLGKPTRVAERSYAGGVFEAHVFQRALFPVTSGVQVVPAPQLTYSLPQSSSYFSREERSVVRAESASFIVRELPVDGRPDDFNGAVGVFKSSVRIDTAFARMGDPLVLTLRVQGIGNVKLLPRPTIELDWASVVPGTERIQVDSSGPLVRGTKEFDWILTPARDGRVSVPSLRYAHFNPYTARYAVAESEPVGITVRAGSLAAGEEGETVALMPLRSATDLSRMVTMWSAVGRPPTSWLVWIVLALLAPLPALWWGRAGRTAARRTSASRTGPGAAPGATPDDDGSARGVARTTRRTFLAALASRFDQTPQALVSRVHVARVLRRAGVTRETTREVMALLGRLDEIGFAADDMGVSATSADTMAAHATTARAAEVLLRRIEAEALPRGRQISATGVVTLALAIGLASATIGVAPLRAQDGTPVSAQAAGREAYAHRAFTEAAQRFGALAAQYPLNPDLLVDWGTAAWAAGDTVDAVIAWQRAARLDPMAADVQERIRLLPSGARGGIADVPMIPVAWLVPVSLSLWLAGWSVMGWSAWRRRRAGASVGVRTAQWIRGTARMVLLLAIAAGATAWWGMRALDASALAVVARPETLRIAPGTDSDAMGGVTTGDVVRVVESRDAWQRVVHADGRRGWLPTARLVALHDQLPGDRFVR